MSKVYLPNLAGHDYSDLKRYGDVVTVTTGTQDRYSVSNMYRMWVDVLKDSKPEDYLVLTGLSIFSSIGSAVFGYKHHRLNLLIWRNNKYLAREVFLDNLLGEEEEKNAQIKE